MMRINLAIPLQDLLVNMRFKKPDNLAVKHRLMSGTIAKADREETISTDRTDVLKTMQPYGECFEGYGSLQVVITVSVDCRRSHYALNTDPLSSLH
ncbi:hypothetical protein FFF34_002780 [Inquilinus sp. KBS0705]|nr:hypothetical protein FFF34_002780 [Inquilinus sp. KBS0705]